MYRGSEVNQFAGGTQVIVANGGWMIYIISGSKMLTLKNTKTNKDTQTPSPLLQYFFTHIKTTNARVLHFVGMS